ncbi:MAG: alpha-1,4-glucan--maltose-1-phosphate maltosyltransferase [Thermodesulfobacteriota bacterium]
MTPGPDPTRLDPALARRVWIENLAPAVDGGLYPIKRVVGESVTVSADILVDGHEAVAGVLRFRPASQADWSELPLGPLGNDAWQGIFPITTLEPYHYAVAAWIDRFASWCQVLVKKHQAGQEVASELLEGAALVQAAAARGADQDALWLASVAARLAAPTPVDERVCLALAPELAALMGRYPDRSRETTTPTLLVSVERPRARTGAWYEMFPRSATTDPARSGSFRDAATRLPAIAALGFDVLYLPPIHPIGKSHRKGRNNSPQAAAGDPGSPWAIGTAEGGHDAVHPELGTIEDFTAFRRQAEAHGLEIALDLAFQCSPDHPYVAEHPEWFRHRPDGTIRYAENPPKQYQDIFPLDFEGPAWEALWQELLRVTLFWVGHGVRIFRVDNPHTKPLRFWAWLIHEVRTRHPDVVFLAEAFTRPKLMYALAKVGFSQSYTYFTWRNTKTEIIAYLRELTSSPVREFFRPNLFANTPDILPEYLQYSGRPGFVVRLVLAATLGASYGIYSGFELCEGQGLPGTEDYLDSEKYQLRPRDWQRPDGIQEFVARINAIRRGNPALATNDSLTFHAVDNEHLIAYSKHTPDLENIILVVANLDPHHAHDGWLELPIAALGIGPAEVFQAHDLIGEGRYLWQGAKSYVRLDPAASPAQIFRLRRRVRTEQDFEYFM